MATNNASLIRGRKRIAAELGCCERTVTRLINQKMLPARKAFSGGDTSPLVIERKAIEDFKSGKKD